MQLAMNAPAQAASRQGQACARPAAVRPAVRGACSARSSSSSLEQRSMHQAGKVRLPRAPCAGCAHPWMGVSPRPRVLAAAISTVPVHGDADLRMDGQHLTWLVHPGAS